MQHICGRASSEKVLHVFNEDPKATDKKCSAVKAFNHNSKTDGQHKVKRLKTRKERCQMKSGWKETSKSYYHHCHHQSRKDMAFFQNCSHNSCQRTSRKNTPISSTVSAPQEPSIITDSRLIGHYGLFNREVKSIDIERLLSKHNKREKIGQQVEEKSSDTMHLSSTFHIPAALSRDDVVGTDAGDIVPFEEKVDPAAKTHDDNLEVKTHQFDKQGSNILPSQRQKLYLSSGSCKSNLSCKHNIQNLETTKTNNNVPSGKDCEPLLTPSANTDNVKTLNCDIKRHTISDLEQPHENRDHQTQTDGVNPNSFQLSSSPSADCFDIQHRKQDPEYVSESVSALAAQLCERLHLPLLKRRDLLSESRKELLKSLKERHGSSLQANLHEVQQWVRLGMCPTQTTQDRECTTMEEDELLSTDTSIKTNRSKHYNWKSSPLPHQSLHQTAEWVANPVDTSANLLDESFIPSLSPQFYMDFEQYGSSASGLFSQPPTSCREMNASAADPWEDIFSKSKSGESVFLDSFKNSFMNHTREVGESSQRPQYHCRNIQPLFPYQAHLSDGHSEEPLHFRQEQDPFGADRHSFVPFFPAQIHRSPQRSQLQPFSQFSQTSACTTFRSHHIDMMHYPPSHMLENSPAPPSSSFTSPDRWSFPPMRLY